MEVDKQKKRTLMRKVEGSKSGRAKEEELGEELREELGEECEELRGKQKQVDGRRGDRDGTVPRTLPAPGPGVGGGAAARSAPAIHIIQRTLWGFGSGPEFGFRRKPSAGWVAARVIGWQRHLGGREDD
jgi:hypothetical protein